MTTNAACLDDCAATDSRWTIKVKGNDDNELGIIMLDDTGFNKIELCNKTALLFAGSADLINEWKKYFFREIDERPPMFLDKDKSVAWVVIDFRGQIISSRHEMAITDYESYYFMGTGSGFAYECWRNNKCIVKSVDSAKSNDKFSGGETKFIKRDFASNLQPYDSRVFREFTLMANKEVAMFRSIDGNVFNISDENLDKETRTAINDVFKAENMVAHFEGMDIPLSEEQQAYAEGAAKQALDVIWNK